MLLAGSHRLSCTQHKCYTLMSRHAVRVRATTNTSHQVLESTLTSDCYTRDPQLQTALDDLFADTIDKGHRRVQKADIAHHTERIEQLGKRLGLNRIKPEWNDGAFRGLLTSITTGINEEDQCTLARLTFGQVGPPDLMVELDQAEAAGLHGEPDQLKGPLANIPDNPARGYALVTYFKILSNGVFGRMTARARYDLDEEDTTKLHVTFTGLLLEPATSDAQSLALWRDALGECNPSMFTYNLRRSYSFHRTPQQGPDGSIVVDLKVQPRAWTRYLVMEPDLNLGLSMRGSLMAALEELFAVTVRKGLRRFQKEDIQHHIERIAELGCRLGLNRVNPQWNNGTFLQILTTTTSGVSIGEVCSLQRLTFGQVRPADLQVELGDAFQVGRGGTAGNASSPRSLHFLCDCAGQKTPGAVSAIRGQVPGVEGSAVNAYALNTYFKIVQNGVEGTMAPEGLYDTDEAEPSRLRVTFSGFKVSPERQDAQSLALWRETLEGHNPEMDEHGVIRIVFPKPIRATIEYILMEPDLHMHLGASGDFTAVQRQQQPN
ncbi:hypothetical protein VOLCADRAFT_120315 [Volvox carteri f. nagariensis]|uniref:Uncharacterized protein n=1 Tax=Volvox carteri f. nagariensis TaxID=3068 RepID=D8TJK5_VOLCA|nr:uncharacterized protein VOLCADRAFT_120315 [Volvox carteri f. nagariensis]EFJ52388.1 hypothetical protein VOLCADRAFT_120315 [Volvox carteri f. nagariensis]|eukprot:XP_002946461.1 hypothetical protein VOLCADRAFT_120315 [Volvox carteri f. nagariensis]